MTGISDTLYTALVSGGSSTLSAVLTCYIYSKLKQREEEERKKTEKELDELREKRMIKIEDNVDALDKKLDKHEADDKSREILNELKHISGQQAEQSSNIRQMSGKIETLLINDSSKTATLDSVTRYIKGVDDSLKEHKLNHPGEKK